MRPGQAADAEQSSWAGDGDGGVSLTAGSGAAAAAAWRWRLACLRLGLKGGRFATRARMAAMTGDACVCVMSSKGLLYISILAWHEVCDAFYVLI